MKIKILKAMEVEAKYVIIDIPVRYDDEDMPYDFPLRTGDNWKATVEIDTGKIVEWKPEFGAQEFSMKVCDEGTYKILDENKEVIAEIKQDYVPNRLIPGSYGDYIELEISQEGIITNWPRNPSAKDFLNNNDSDE